MNEQKLYDHWKAFATKHNLVFESEDKRHLQGAISEISIKKEGKTLIQARIGKTRSGYELKSTKIHLFKGEVVNQKIRIKNRWYAFLWKRSNSESKLLSLIKKHGASELSILNGSGFIEYNYILYSEEELQMALNLKSEITQTLKLNKS